MSRVMLSLATVTLIAGTLPTLAAETAAPVKPREVRSIYSGKWNGVPTLTKWMGAYWCAFRHATDHNSNDGAIIVLRSADAKTWTEAFRLKVQPDLPDDRDPQWLATEKRLFLYTVAMKNIYPTVLQCASFVTYTDDGKKWTKPEPVYERGRIFWRPIAHQGRFWATAHKVPPPGQPRAVDLITSSDGLKWEKVSTIRAGNFESETTLLMQGNKAVAFLRQIRSPAGRQPGYILESEAPYKEWTSRTPNVNHHFSGQTCSTFKGVTYFLTRTGYRQPNERVGVGIFTYEKDGSLKLYCRLAELPGGDGAYAVAVEKGDNMLVVYYAGSPDKADIYLAEVPLKK